MAFDFLQYSPHFVRSSKDEKVQMRRRTVLEYLDDKYERTVSSPEIAKAIGVENWKVVAVDVDIYRLAYLFLAGTAEDKARLRKRAKHGSDPSMKGVKALIADGIESWGEIERLAQSDTQGQEPVPADPLEQSFAQIRAYRESLENEIRELRSQVKSLQSIAADNIRLAEENEVLRELLEEESKRATESVSRLQILQRPLITPMPTQERTETQFVMKCGDWARGADVLHESRFLRQWRKNFKIPEIREAVIKKHNQLVLEGPSRVDHHAILSGPRAGRSFVKIGRGRHALVYKLEKGQGLRIFEFVHHDDLNR